MKKSIILVCCFLLLVQGCGYSFYGRSGVTQIGVSKVFVRDIVNTSNEANLETMLRNALLNKLIRSGSLKITANKEAADATIAVNIRSLVISPLSLTASNIAAQARISVILDAELLRNANDVPIWKMTSFTKSGDYSISTKLQGVSLTEAQKQEALTNLCGDVSDHLFSLMFSGF